MPSCSSCGGDNPPAATVCGYCDQALVGEKLLEVAWTGHTSEGAHGEGRAAVMAPLGADPERVRSVCEAAFAASVDALGAEASAEQIAADMRERVGKLLPTDHPLKDLTVTQFQAFLLVAEAPTAAAPASSPAAAATGLAARGVLGCGLLAIGGCCLLTGLIGFWVGGGKQAVAKQMQKAQVVDAPTAFEQGGKVALEGAVASTDSAVIVKDTRGAAPVEIPCLYVRLDRKLQRVEPRTDPQGNPELDPATGKQRTRTVVRTSTEHLAVVRFTVGQLSVEPTTDVHTHYVALENLPEWVEGDTTFTPVGLRVETPLTLYGRVQGGLLKPQPGDSLVISGLPTRDATVKALLEEAAGDRTFGLVAAAFGAFFLLLGLVSFLRRKKA